MKRILILSAILVIAAAVTVSAAPGDVYILPIDHLDGGGWTTLPGAGYNGTNAYSANTIDGVRRVYWSVPNLTQALYLIEWFRPTTGAAGWQPIESQIRGVDGENYPNDPLIPWVGAFGTNHQYIGAENGTPGTWVSTGSGPHTPESEAYGAGANGKYMWLGGHTGNSWLYAKWDYGWAIDHAWSALRLTEVVIPTPEPGSLLAMGAGLISMAGMAFRRRK